MYRHGLSGTKAYRAWKAMKTRCSNPKSPGFHRYGGRGISYCKRWEVFENFYVDLGDAPAGHSLERNNLNMNYSPGNCRWATPVDQTRNRSITLRATIRGETRTVKEWCEKLGEKYDTVHDRIVRQMMRPEQAFGLVD